MSKELTAFIERQKDNFIALNAANDDLLSFEKECIFASQQIVKNDFTFKIAQANSKSLESAILNIAAIGISLNPASQHAYLVPRSGAICLDISYQGLKKIATDSGAIEWAKVELVYDNDEFKWNGPTESPSHSADPFSEDRGKLKGGYCIAKLPCGGAMIEVMSIDEINKVRETSKAKNGPWVNWFDEMAKKTIIKRAFKQWPQTPNCKRDRLDKAVEVSHQAEGTAYTLEQYKEYMQLHAGSDPVAFYMMRLRTDEEGWNALYNSFAKGEKVKNKAIADELEREGIETINGYAGIIIESMGVNDESSALELISELTEQEYSAVTNLLQPQEIQWVESIKEAA